MLLKNDPLLTAWRVYQAAAKLGKGPDDVLSIGTPKRDALGREVVNFKMKGWPWGSSSYTLLCTDERCFADFTGSFLWKGTSAIGLGCTSYGEGLNYGSIESPSPDAASWEIGQRAGGGDSNKPEAGSPDIIQSGPDIIKSELPSTTDVVSETFTPDTTKPDIATPDVGKPEVVAETGTPDIPKPDTVKPDVGTPDTAAEIATPDTVKPDSGPEITADIGPGSDAGQKYMCPLVPYPNSVVTKEWPTETVVCNDDNSMCSIVSKTIGVMNSDMGWNGGEKVTQEIVALEAAKYFQGTLPGRLSTVQEFLGLGNSSICEGARVLYLDRAKYDPDPMEGALGASSGQCDITIYGSSDPYNEKGFMSWIGNSGSSYPYSVSENGFFYETVNELSTYALFHKTLGLPVNVLRGLGLYVRINSQVDMKLKANPAKLEENKMMGIGDNIVIKNFSPYGSTYSYTRLTYKEKKNNSYKFKMELCNHNEAGQLTDAYYTGNVEIPKGQWYNEYCGHYMLAPIVEEGSKIKIPLFARCSPYALDSCNDKYPKNYIDSQWDNKKSFLCEKEGLALYDEVIKTNTGPAPMGKQFAFLPYKNNDANTAFCSWQGYGHFAVEKILNDLLAAAKANGCTKKPFPFFETVHKATGLTVAECTELFKKYGIPIEDKNYTPGGYDNIL